MTLPPSNCEISTELEIKEQEIEWLLNCVFTEKLKTTSALLRGLTLKYKEDNLWETAELVPVDSNSIGHASGLLVASKITELNIYSQKSSASKTELVNLKFKDAESYIFPQLVNLVRNMDASIKLIEDVTRFISPLVAIELIKNLKKKLIESIELFNSDESTSLQSIIEMDQNLFIGEMKDNRLVDIRIVGCILHINVINIQPSNTSKISDIFSTLTNSTSSGNTMQVFFSLNDFYIKLYKNDVCKIRYETNLQARLESISESLDMLNLLLESCEIMLNQISYLL
ncbi:hypothetical protein BB561_002614 [Smittium simulii]|uniref:Uncharacterized protein n=1 Tax=Smittium simulii TaxID=133385 RepID=A0A2T9YPU6_9FUNG|nr:hypothetical protein BB561_002614 [Smittium simulii]